MPYEHKRGRPPAAPRPGAGLAQRPVQVTAYALLMEEEAGPADGRGSGLVHAENVTVRVPIDEAARATYSGPRPRPGAAPRAGAARR